MTLRRTFTGLTLCNGPGSVHGLCGNGPPPMVVMDTPPPASTPALFCERFQPGPPGRPHHRRAQVGTLHFNDEVAILEINSGWARVGDVGPRTGWASMRYLQPVPADRPRSAAPGSGRRLPRSRPSPPQPPRPCRGGSFGQVRGGIPPVRWRPRLTSPGLVRIWKGGQPVGRSTDRGVIYHAPVFVLIPNRNHKTGICRGAPACAP